MNCILLYCISSYFILLNVNVVRQDHSSTHVLLLTAPDFYYCFDMFGPSGLSSEIRLTQCLVELIQSTVIIVHCLCFVNMCQNLWKEYLFNMFSILI